MQTQTSNDRVIDARMWLGVFKIRAVIDVVTLLTIDICQLGGSMKGTGDQAMALTAGSRCWSLHIC